MHPIRPFAALAACAFLTACGGAPPSPEITAEGGQPAQCALDGAENFVPDCRILVGDEAGHFVIRHPDGGFRRLRAAAGEIEALDGSHPAVTLARTGEQIDVAVDADRYRFDPAGVVR